MPKYKQVELPDIFRSEKLPSARDSPPYHAAQPTSYFKRKANSFDEGSTPLYRKLDTPEDMPKQETSTYGSSSKTAGALTWRSTEATQAQLMGSHIVPTSTTYESPAVDSSAIALFSPQASSASVSPIARQSMPANEHLDVVEALIPATISLLKEGSPQFDYGSIKHKASERLGYGHWFRNVRSKEHEWHGKSGRVMRWAAASCV